MYLGGMFEGMPSYEKVKETPVMGRLYKINPTCPYCGKEHEYWTIHLTDEEQQVLDGSILIFFRWGNIQCISK